jgi:hypothetical protein
MNNQDFYSYYVERKDKQKEAKGLVFKIPNEYLLQLTDSAETLRRIETILTSITLPLPTSTTVVGKINKTQEVTEKVSTLKKKIDNLEIKEAPFLSLKLASSPDFYKISKTFLDDVEKGVKHFGFHRLQHELKESFISIFASFISYSKNNIPVLIVVDDFEMEDWKKIKKNFSIGSIGMCRCYDWGNVTILERKQILRSGNVNFKSVYDLINDQFDVVFWSIGSQGVLNEYSSFSFFVLEAISSVTLISPKDKTFINEVMNNNKFYNEYKIPIKGILYGERR